jgi:hypothetical protein
MSTMERYSRINDVQVYDMDRDAVIATADCESAATAIVAALNFMADFREQGRASIKAVNRAQTRWEMFAAAALTGILADSSAPLECKADSKLVARGAAHFAEAMLAESDKRSGCAK